MLIQRSGGPKATFKTFISRFAPKRVVQLRVKRITVAFRAQDLAELLDWSTRARSFSEWGFRYKLSRIGIFTQKIAFKVLKVKFVAVRSFLITCLGDPRGLLFVVKLISFPVRFKKAVFPINCIFILHFWASKHTNCISLTNQRFLQTSYARFLISA